MLCTADGAESLFATEGADWSELRGEAVWPRKARMGRSFAGRPLTTEGADGAELRGEAICRGGRGLSGVSRGDR